MGFSVWEEKKCSNYLPEIRKLDWESKDDKERIQNNEKRRGAYWNIAFCDNEFHLKYFIGKILIKKENREEISEDLIIWAIVNSLLWDKQYRNEYIRMLKILLNHDTVVHDEAWYECQAFDQYLYYCKYTVCHIPQYYGKHLSKCEKQDSELYEQIRYCVGGFRNENEWDKDTEIDSVPVMIMEEMKKRICSEFGDDCKAGKILERRVNCFKGAKSDAVYKEMIDHENVVRGIIEVSKKDKDKIINNDYDLLSNVMFSWPTRNGTDSIQDICVLLKCFMDKIYFCYNWYDNKNVFYTVINALDGIVKPFCKNSEFVKEQSFWRKKERWEAYRLEDRQSNTATTYAIQSTGGDAYWAKMFWQDQDNGEIKSKHVRSIGD